MLQPRKFNFEILIIFLTVICALDVFTSAYADNHTVGTTRISFVSKEKSQSRPESSRQKYKHHNNEILPQTNESQSNVYMWLSINTIGVIIFLKLFFRLRR